MQVSVETTGSLTRKMTIAVPAGEFEGRIADRVRSTAKTVSLPGFRRGRVPLKEVERRFGDALRSEVASDLVKSSLEDALRQEELPMVGAPSVELVNLDPGADLEFTATFEVLPEVDLVDLSTLHVRRPFAEIGETDIDEMVESLRKQRTEWNPVERAVAADDRVVVDYSVTVDGEVVGEPQADFTFVVGSSQVATELDTAVVGMTVGETRAFPLTIQRNIDETSGDVEAIGEVALKSLEAPSLPELDGDFFESFGVVEKTGLSDDDAPTGDGAGSPDDGGPDGPVDGENGVPPGTFAQFRANVRERMAAELEAAARNETRRQVMASLARAHRFELPRVLVEEELEQERERAVRLMGVQIEHAGLGDIVEQRVRERVRTRLVVREVVRREGLQVDDERIRARIEEIVAPYEQPDDVRNWIYGDEEQLQRVELDVLEDQLVEHVLAKATVETVAATYKDVVTGNSIPALPVEAGTSADVDLGGSPLERDDAGHAEAASGGDAAVGEADKPAKGRLRRWFGGKRA
ncbi:MAG: trigger factor [Gammaproteobacteria bacterium]|nr:trigger factor [Gammaproteobacteria bacterium]MYK48243.1 trigger factor [Gammaproteobacteria bacterium]